MVRVSQRHAGGAMLRQCCDLLEMSPFRTLSPELIARLGAIGRAKHLARDEVLVASGEQSGITGCVVSGVLRMQKTLIEGQQQIVGLLVAGDMFGRVFDGSFPFAIEAATECKICLFPKAGFEALVESSPDLERLVVRTLLSELDSAREWLGLLANHRVIDKVAGFLVFLHRRWPQPSHTGAQPGHGTLIDLPISRQDLANVLGTRPEAISRAIHALQNQELIEIVTPYRFVIRDIDRLDLMSGQSTGDDDTDAAPLARDGRR